MSTNNQLGYVILIAVLMLVIGVLSTALYFNTTNNNATTISSISSTDTSLGLKSSSEFSMSVAQQSLLPIPTLSQSSVVSSVSKVPIVFIPSGKFTEDLKKELTERFALPFIDYTNDPYHAYGDTVVSFTFEKYDNTPQTPVGVNEFGIKTTYITKNGGSGGELIRKDNTGHVAWFVPGCMLECKFNESYKLKYPEVVSEYKNNK